MATTIDPRVVINDDSGTPANPVGDGSTINNDLFQQIQDAVDALFTGALVLGGNLTLEGGNLSVVGTAAISSNATVGGTLGVTGGATVGGQLAVTGQTTLNSTGGNIVNSALGNAIAFFVRGRSSDNTSRILFQRFAGSLSQAAIDGLDATLRFATGSGPTTRLTIGDTAITPAVPSSVGTTLTPATLNADAHDYNPPGLTTASLVRLVASAPGLSITGIVGGFPGRILYLVNAGAETIALVQESASSTNINRFTNARNLLQGDTAIILYDGTSLRWQIAS